MDLTRLSPDDLDLDTADEIAAVTNEANAGLQVPAATGPGWMLASRHQHERPTKAIWVARDGDRVVGWANLAHTTTEYLDVARVGGAVAPSHQRRGIGRALLRAAAGATDRPTIKARAYRGSPGETALPALGLRPEHTSVVRRLDLTQPREQWATLASEARSRAGDYVLERRVGPTPDSAMAEMVVLREAINDAPDSFEYEAYPPERIAAYESDLVAQRQTQYSIVARHAGSGEPAGLTMCCVDEFAPSVAHQEDTSVLPAHRGHRLGALLKLDMIDWLRSERPEIAATDTWNDETNHHMIAINERLGLDVVAHSTTYGGSRAEVLGG